MMQPSREHASNTKRPAEIFGISNGRYESHARQQSVEEKDTKPISELKANDQRVEELAVHGLLLAKGNFVDGRKAWVVESWESRNLHGHRLQLVPDSCFMTLLEHLDAFGGGEYVLHYRVRLTGRLLESSRFAPLKLIAETDDGLVSVDCL